MLWLVFGGWGEHTWLEGMGRLVQGRFQRLRDRALLWNQHAARRLNTLTWQVQPDRWHPSCWWSIVVRMGRAEGTCGVDREVLESKHLSAAERGSPRSRAAKPTTHPQSHSPCTPHTFEGAALVVARAITLVVRARLMARVRCSIWFFLERVGGTQRH